MCSLCAKTLVLLVHVHVALPLCHFLLLGQGGAYTGRAQSAAWFDIFHITALPWFAYLSAIRSHTNYSAARPVKAAPRKVAIGYKFHNLTFGVSSWRSSQYG